MFCYIDAVLLLREGKPFKKWKFSACVASYNHSPVIL